ncbi:MAG: ABC transporter substrate-binding protein [Streptosporangiales bacterium]
MRSRTRRGAAMLAVGMLALAAGCGSGGGSADSAKTFTYWSMWQQSEPQAKVLKKAIKGFEHDTGIDVQVEWQGRDVLSKLIPALRSGDVPDLVDQGYGDLTGAIVTNKQYTDLSDVYTRTIPGSGGKTVRDVVPTKYDRFIKTDDGTPFFVPYEITGACIWYNAKRLPKVASGAPQTWQEFTDLLAKRKASGHAPLALDGDIAGYAAYWTSIAVIRALGPNGLRDLATDKDASGWGKPGVRDAIAGVADLVGKHYFVDGYDSSKFPAIQRKWVEGKADFLLLGSWAPSETGKSAPAGFTYRCFNYPRLADDYSVPTNAIGFAVPKPAEHAKAAEKFIAYFMNKERLSGISSTAKNLTPRTDIKPPKELADLKNLLDEQKPSEVLVGALADMPDYRQKVFLPLSDKLLGGGLTADGFIAQMKKDQQQYWRTHD